MVVSLSSSNISMEQSFGVLTLMLSSRPIRRYHDTLQDWMSININAKLWTHQERDELIDCAVQMFLSNQQTKKDVEPPVKKPTNQTRCFHRGFFSFVRQRHF